MGLGYIEPLVSLWFDIDVSIATYYVNDKRLLLVYSFKAAADREKMCPKINVIPS